ncbi:MAG: hypothetical protein ACYTFA_01535 [Planctomycetota bacterium]|jgi:hypothetical protein
MNGDRYYYLSALPTLGELGSAPPLRPDQLLERLAPCPAAHRVVEVLFLHNDLLEREGFGAGELTSVRPVVLTAGQVRNESPLPAYLTGGPARPFPANTAWEAYFRYAAGVARTFACRFLADWVRFEVGLRNALAIARARRLGLEVDDHLVAPELGEPAESFAVIISERTAAATPLAELEMLIKARRAWLTEHEAWFSFSDDEFAAYAAKLMLLIQYEQLVKAAEQSASTREGVEALAQLEEVTG